jgi:TetR/AcrR family transcriptional regulator, cholesterol catabolism regulator
VQNVSNAYLCAMFNEQQAKWLRQAEAVFLRYGIKSITMDDVARELGISKKTLYQFVENKDDLVRKVLQQHIETDKQFCTTEFSKAPNAVEEIMVVIDTNSTQIRQMKANIVYDLQKYHREAWLMMQNYQQGFLYETVSNNLKRGISEGLYRESLNVDIVTRLHIATSFQLFNEDIFPSSQFSREVVFREYLMHYLYGILSEKGVKTLNNILTRLS